jgi:hypothetical protein
MAAVDSPCLEGTDKVSNWWRLELFVTGSLMLGANTIALGCIALGRKSGASNFNEVAADAELPAVSRQIDQNENRRIGWRIAPRIDF